MKKKAIILAVIFLLILSGIFIFFSLTKSSNSQDERVLYTDAPGDVAGKEYIDGEVFIIEKDDPYFER